MTPPKLATRLLHRFLRDELREEVTGDLEERFRWTVKKRSLRAARWRYWVEVIGYFRLFAIRKMKPTTAMMYKHNLLISYRSFRRYKASFFINLVGLSFGLAAAIMIWLWVNDELMFDKFHANDKRLFEVMEQRQYPDHVEISDESSGIMAETLTAQMPDVEYAAAVAPSNWFPKFTLSIGDQKVVRATGQYVGQDYFNIFSFKLLSGDQNSVLADKNNIVLSKSMALKLFGDTDNVVGKTLEFQHEREFVISGIFEDVPVHSSEQFDFLLSFEYYKDIQGWVKSWGNTGPHIYVVLKSGTDVKSFDKKIANVVSDHTDNHFRTPFLLPYSDNYLYNSFDHGARQGGRIEYVRLFSIIAVFILLIACINFMTLSTARASRRLKEVGIKKTVGAKRRQLIYQFMSESMLLSLLSTFISIGIVAALLPAFNQLTAKQIHFSADPGLYGMVFIVMVATGVISGSYPALYLSGFNPIAILKGKLNNSVGEVWTRKGLVVFQFTLSVILMVAVVVVYEQVQFIQSKKLGFNKDNVVYFNSEGRVLGTQEVFLSEMKKIPGVLNASGSWHNIIGRNFSTSDIDWVGKDPKEITLFEGMGGGYDILQTLGITMKEGRDFSESYHDEYDKIILNEAAVKFIGFGEPLGKKIDISGRPREIIGVMNDFHYESLHKPVGPMYYMLDTGGNNTWYKIYIKIKAGTEKETMAHIEDFYKTYNPGFVLDYYFLDQAFQKMYMGETRIAVLSQYFAGIAILISCLGLFGLTAFTAERRIKEIGIRKILGSSNTRIVYLLSQEFTKIVLAAVVIALPTSYLLSRFWLSTFAYRIDLSPWFFIGAGLTALLIAWLTISLQTLKASRIKPVNCLKTE